jgi:prefoldin subunit 5
MSCHICTEEIKVRNPTVKCQYCEFEACRSCCERYILDQTIAKCMNNDCDKEWTRKHIAQNFTKSFLTGAWKKNREKVLFDKEKALLPATQGQVQNSIEKDEIAMEIKKVNEEIKNIKMQYSRLMDKKNKLHQSNNRLHSNNNYTLQGTNLEKTNYVRACPDGDCRGYLNGSWKCGLCNKTTCSKCHIMIQPDQDHECNKDDVETANLLKKDTKPCPTCSTGIFKIDGCDQMWCTQCHTAFSWKTGRIENAIHNPHYFEWVRKNGQQANFGQDNYICGQELNHQVWNHIRRKINMFEMSVPKNIDLQIEYIIRNLLHFKYSELRRYRITADHEDNTELRIKYLRNLITNEEFAKKIQQSNKSYEKKKELNQILSLFERVSSEIILRLAQNTDQWINQEIQNKNIVLEHLNQTIAEINGIIQYTNQALTELSQTYGTVHKYIKFATKRNRDLLTTVVKPKNSTIVTGPTRTREQHVIDLSV